MTAPGSRFFIVSIVFLITLGFLLFSKVWLADEIQYMRYHKKELADSIAAGNERIKTVRYGSLQKFTSPDRIIKFAEDSLGLETAAETFESLEVDKDKISYIEKTVKEKYE